MTDTKVKTIRTSLRDQFSTSIDANDKNDVLAIPTTLNGKNQTNQINNTLPEYVVIEPSEQATFSSETAASISALPVKEGSTFKKGDVLIKLDCSIQNAELKKAKATQSEAMMAYKSAMKLKGYGTISEFELVQATTQKDMADAEVDKLLSIVKKCVIYAPFNGAVAKVDVHLYESVKPGDPLLKIVSTDKLDFVVQVPSTWLEWLHIGTTFMVDISEINKVVEVKVAKIAPVINSVSQTIKIVAVETSDTHDPNLLPGMSGRANFSEKPVGTTDKLPE